MTMTATNPATMGIANDLDFFDCPLPVRAVAELRRRLFLLLIVSNPPSMTAILR
jgi:hypothetical protein